MRTLKEIEEEMDSVQNTGNIGRMMDLVDEHGNMMDKMYEAIIEGDLDRIRELEDLGIDITEDSFMKTAVLHDQLLVITYQVNKGADVDAVIDFARQKDEPVVFGSMSFSGNDLIWKWARSWKSANALSEKLPAKDQPEKKAKI
ncbi:hypothetical protein [Ralstonia pseudosolanacearum]|uniref:hypothetical protein n=1 Tax=Ralstonia pseudosolanacearum TaxID=1310165 RepID=UPI0026747D63|nr:hypothetical protein [Ralstonia pseudosolanacearum]MDO3552052.1 hypothetical protein [Ralstonia pseudosolanacearum]